MPDILTTEERRAIDRAIAEGRVRRIPEGHMATAIHYEWRKVDRQPSQLVQVAGPSIALRKVKRQQFGRNVKPAMKTRRDRVRAMVLQGLTQEAIAEELGVSTNTVKVDVSELRKAEMLPPPPPRTWRRAEAAKKRQEKVLELLQQGMSQRQIAKHLGCARQCVVEDCAALRTEGRIKEKAA
jgi:DNA-binding NarL/FixJ family response regulator